MKIVGRDYIRRVIFLEDHPAREEQLEQDIVEPTIKEEVYDYVPGMFEDKIPLHRWIFQDGRVYEEREQITIWSSGPVIFTALFDLNEDRWVRGTRWLKTDLDRF